MPRAILFILAAALIVAVVSGTLAYRRDMRHHYARVGAAGTVLASPHGDIEYSEGGAGPDVLVIHGSGGGYDQGRLIAEVVLGEQFHWIAPSRFGYLRSTFRDGDTWDDQADAYAYLLDELGIESVAVVAMSHGGPSALVFAALYPDRVSSLTLISCGVASSSEPGQSQADRKGSALTTIYKSDFVYWASSRFFRRQFMGLIGATDAVVDGLTPTQRQMVVRIIDEMNPASLRSAGVAFDNQALLPGDRIATIEAPTLVIHARDDTLQLYHNAEFAAHTIADSELFSFEHGGHVVMIVEQPTIRGLTRERILHHLPSGSL